MCRMLRSTEIAPREATVAAGDSVTPVAEGVEAVWAATAPSQATTWLLVRATPEAEGVGHSAMRAGPKEAGPAIWAVMANRQGSCVEGTGASQPSTRLLAGTGRPEPARAGGGAGARLARGPGKMEEAVTWGGGGGGGGSSAGMGGTVASEAG